MKSMNNRKISGAVSSEQQWGRAQHDCLLPTAHCRLALVVVAGAGIEAVNGSYTLDYEDDWSAYYVDGEWAYGVSIFKDEFAWGASIVELDLWEDLYATDNWPEGWTVVGGAAPAPVVGYEQIAVTNLVDRSAAVRWELAHDWGDHAAVGYLTEETNPGALALDQGEPQSMSGFPLVVGNAWSVGGALLNNGSRACLGTWDAGGELTEFSVAFWLRTTSTATYRRLIDHPDFIVMTDNSGSVQFICYTPSYSATPIGGAIKINDGVWRHVAAVYSDSTMRTYVDGVELASMGTAASFRYTGSTLALSGNTTGTQAVTGQMDGVSIWTRGLEVAEVEELADPSTIVHPDRFFASTGNPMSALSAHYGFNEGSGTSTYDLVTGAAATLSHTTMWSDGVARNDPGAAGVSLFEIESDMARGRDPVLRIGGADGTGRWPQTTHFVFDVRRSHKQNSLK